MDSCDKNRFDIRLRDVARKKCSRGVWFNDGDVDRFLASIKEEVTREMKQERIKSIDIRTQRIKETAKYSITGVSTITYSCLADAEIRVYNRAPVKDGAAGGGTVGGVGGAVGGAAGGALIGAAAGSFVPVVGNFVGGIVGGIIGGVTGLVGGGLSGAAAGAGIGSAVSNDQYVIITAKEVFEGLPGYRNDGRTVYCEM